MKGLGGRASSGSMRSRTTWDIPGKGNRYHCSCCEQESTLNIEHDVPCSNKMFVIKLLDVTSWRSRVPFVNILNERKIEGYLQTSAAHLVIVFVLQSLDAAIVDEHLRSLPSSQARIVGLEA